MAAPFRSSYVGKSCLAYCSSDLKSDRKEEGENWAKTGKSYLAYCSSDLKSDGKDKGKNWARRLEI